MPQRNRPQLAIRQHVRDPLSACLDADSTYICTAYNSRCYIIQKVTPPTVHPNLNPDADTFESSKNKRPEQDCYEIVESEFPPLEVFIREYSVSLNCEQAGRRKLAATDQIRSHFSDRRSVYMNGDVAKVPPGAVFTATPEPHAPSPTTDFNLLNGVTDPLDNYSDGGALPVGGQAPPEQAAPETNTASPIAIDQLKQMLSSQLEYYFSRENLANDTYLLSQMDNDQYVPIWTVANFNQVKKLTTDIKLITEVLRESPNVQVDDEGQKVRPNHKRCIVILREIPESTPLEEVKGLFSGKGCPKLISCEFAHNNSWYVTFENDEDAQKAYRFLREEVREFQGKPIMARIKAKPMTMNRLPMPNVAPGMAGMKNGYRTPPASANSASVYDPTTAYPTGQQRYIFNGTSLPPNVNYNHQVQIYFQQQPFYPPNVPLTWGPAAAAAAYFDIGSVFTANGLAPQGSFGKTHPNRFAPNRRHKKTPVGLEQRSSMSDSGLGVRGPGAKPLGTMKLDSNNLSSPMKPHYYRDPSQADSSDHSRHDLDDSYRPPLSSSKEPLPARRRRKEDEGPAPRGTGSPGPQFDLEADAFPPLPGHETSSHGHSAASGASKAAAPAPVAPTTPASAPSVQPVPPPTAAAAAATPAPSHEPAALDQTTWPENRSVLGTAGTVKTSPAEKVKTEEAVINGSSETGVTSPVESPIEAKVTSYNAAVISSLPEPVSLPPAHTPSSQVSPVQQAAAHNQTDLGVIKLSYAQVAQHHKEKAEREKHQLLQQQQQQQQQQQHVAPGQQQASTHKGKTSLATTPQKGKELSAEVEAAPEGRPREDGIISRDLIPGNVPQNSTPHYD
ncbi:hypothetical protein GE061_003868 [Apolygus lucorum]|uniref:Uncharacterized protein n=1 Tax=Apolygus lucorum TaxID=248454 RepID=A0A6A4J411_APOLU|nr:hypothetical protein GE061_003868 [Apolygus lucorum]